MAAARLWVTHSPRLSGTTAICAIRTCGMTDRRGSRRLVFRESLTDQIGPRPHFQDTRRRVAGAPKFAPAGGAAFSCSDVDVLSDFDGATLGQGVGIGPCGG